MNINNPKLAEKTLLFLYTLSEISPQINLNTFKRYLYLYYLTSSFLSGEEDIISIYLDKGDVKILDLEEIISNFEAKEYIDISKNQIDINQSLRDLVIPLLKNSGGEFERQYKEIRPFINLLHSYNDHLIFTIFFCEPTFNEANKRGLSTLSSTESKLGELLTKFKEKVKDSEIDEYDILTYWMDYILKNYYDEAGESDVGV